MGEGPRISIVASDNRQSQTAALPRFASEINIPRVEGSAASATAARVAKRIANLSWWKRETANREMGKAERAAAKLGEDNKHEHFLLYTMEQSFPRSRSAVICTGMASRAFLEDSRPLPSRNASDSVSRAALTSCLAVSGRRAVGKWRPRWNLHLTQSHSQKTRVYGHQTSSGLVNRTAQMRWHTLVEKRMEGSDATFTSEARAPSRILPYILKYTRQGV